MMESVGSGVKLTIVDRLTIVVDTEAVITDQALLSAVVKIN